MLQSLKNDFKFSNKSRPIVKARPIFTGRCMTTKLNHKNGININKNVAPVIVGGGRPESKSDEDEGDDDTFVFTDEGADDIEVELSEAEAELDSETVKVELSEAEAEPDSETAKVELSEEEDDTFVFEAEADETAGETLPAVEIPLKLPISFQKRTTVTEATMNPLRFLEGLEKLTKSRSTEEQIKTLNPLEVNIYKQLFLTRDFQFKKATEFERYTADKRYRNQLAKAYVPSDKRDDLRLNQNWLQAVVKETGPLAPPQLTIEILTDKELNTPFWGKIEISRGLSSSPSKFKEKEAKGIRLSEWQQPITSEALRNDLRGFKNQGSARTQRNVNLIRRSSSLKGTDLSKEQTRRGPSSDLSKGQTRDLSEGQTRRESSSLAKSQSSTSAKFQARLLGPFGLVINGGPGLSQVFYEPIWPVSDLVDNEIESVMAVDNPSHSHLLSTSMENKPLRQGKTPGLILDENESEIVLTQAQTPEVKGDLLDIDKYLKLPIGADPVSFYSNFLLSKSTQSLNKELNKSFGDYAQVKIVEADFDKISPKSLADILKIFDDLVIDPSAYIDLPLIEHLLKYYNLDLKYLNQDDLIFLAKKMAAKVGRAKPDQVEPKKPSSEKPKPEKKQPEKSELEKNHLALIRKNIYAEYYPILNVVEAQSIGLVTRSSLESEAAAEAAEKRLRSVPGSKPTEEGQTPTGEAVSTATAEAQAATAELEEAETAELEETETAEASATTAIDETLVIEDQTPTGEAETEADAGQALLATSIATAEAGQEPLVTEAGQESSKQKGGAKKPKAPKNPKDPKGQKESKEDTASTQQASSPQLDINYQLIWTRSLDQLTTGESLFMSRQRRHLISISSDLKGELKLATIPKTVTLNKDIKLPEKYAGLILDFPRNLTDKQNLSMTLIWSQAGYLPYENYLVSLDQEANFRRQKIEDRLKNSLKIRQDGVADLSEDLDNLAAESHYLGFQQALSRANPRSQAPILSQPLRATRSPVLDRLAQTINNLPEFRRKEYLIEVLPRFNALRGWLVDDRGLNIACSHVLAWLMYGRKYTIDAYEDPEDLVCVYCGVNLGSIKFDTAEEYLDGQEEVVHEVLFERQPPNELKKLEKRYELDAYLTKFLNGLTDVLGGAEISLDDLNQPRLHHEFVEKIMGSLSPGEPATFSPDWQRLGLRGDKWGKSNLVDPEIKVFDYLKYSYQDTIAGSLAELWKPIVSKLVEKARAKTKLAAKRYGNMAIIYMDIYRRNYLANLINSVRLAIATILLFNEIVIQFPTKDTTTVYEKLRKGVIERFLKKTHRLSDKSNRLELSDAAKKEGAELKLGDAYLLKTAQNLPLAPIESVVDLETGQLKTDFIDKDTLSKLAESGVPKNLESSKYWTDVYNQLLPVYQRYIQPSMHIEPEITPTSKQLATTGMIFERLLPDSSSRGTESVDSRIGCRYRQQLKFVTLGKLYYVVSNLVKKLGDKLFEATTTPHSCWGNKGDERTKCPISDRFYYITRLIRSETSADSFAQFAALINSSETANDFHEAFLKLLNTPKQIKGAEALPKAEEAEVEEEVEEEEAEEKKVSEKKEIKAKTEAEAEKKAKAKAEAKEKAEEKKAKAKAEEKKAEAKAKAEAKTKVEASSDAAEKKAEAKTKAEASSDATEKKAETKAKTETKAKAEETVCHSLSSDIRPTQSELINLYQNCYDEGEVKIPPDNHCLFIAFGYSLKRSDGFTHTNALAWAKENKMNLRQQASQKVCEKDSYLLERKQDTIQGDIDEGSDHCPEDSRIVSIKTYCELFKESPCWGDDIELQALQKIYKKDALLYDQSRDTIAFRPYEERPLAELVPRSLIYLGYTGNHYESFDPDTFYKTQKGGAKDTAKAEAAKTTTVDSAKAEAEAATTEVEVESKDEDDDDNTELETKADLEQSVKEAKQISALAKQYQQLKIEVHKCLTKLEKRRIVYAVKGPARLMPPIEWNLRYKFLEKVSVDKIRYQVLKSRESRPIADWAANLFEELSNTVDNTYTGLLKDSDLAKILKPALDKFLMNQQLLDHLMHVGNEPPSVETFFNKKLGVLNRLAKYDPRNPMIEGDEPPGQFQDNVVDAVKWQKRSTPSPFKLWWRNTSTDLNHQAALTAWLQLPDSETDYWKVLSRISPIEYDRCLAVVLQADKTDEAWDTIKKLLSYLQVLRLYQIMFKNIINQDGKAGPEWPYLLMRDKSSESAQELLEKVQAAQATGLSKGQISSLRRDGKAVNIVEFPKSKQAQYQLILETTDEQLDTLISWLIAQEAATPKVAEDEKASEAEKKSEAEKASEAEKKSEDKKKSETKTSAPTILSESVWSIIDCLEPKKVVEDWRGKINKQGEDDNLKRLNQMIMNLKYLLINDTLYNYQIQRGAAKGIYLELLQHIWNLIVRMDMLSLTSSYEYDYFKKYEIYDKVKNLFAATAKVKAEVSADDLVESDEEGEPGAVADDDEDQADNDDDNIDGAEGGDDNVVDDLSGGGGD